MKCDEAVNSSDIYDRKAVDGQQFIDTGWPSDNELRLLRYSNDFCAIDPKM